VIGSLYAGAHGVNYCCGWGGVGRSPALAQGLEGTLRALEGWYRAGYDTGQWEVPPASRLTVSIP
jgi:hypothetical protein